MIPPKLKTGDTLAIIAPSRSLSVIGEENTPYADLALSRLGLAVRYMPHIREIDDFHSSSIRSRVEDIHAAFADPGIQGILTVIGGFNSNQLLQYLDYDLISRNPKILCGYSDITALTNAIYARTGMVTYSGPHYSTFGMRKGNHYTVEHFRKCLMEEAEFTVRSSEAWSEDEWWIDQENRTFTKNIGYRILTEGTAEGTLIGGNLCTLNLLQGTQNFPSLHGTILFLEDDFESQPWHFDRNLQSLVHQSGFNGVRGLVIGRMQRASNITSRMLADIVRSKPELMRIPVITDADFGHTNPMMTFPIGGKVRISAEAGKASVTMLEH